MSTILTLMIIVKFIFIVLSFSAMVLNWRRTADIVLATALVHIIAIPFSQGRLLWPVIVAIIWIVNYILWRKIEVLRKESGEWK